MDREQLEVVRLLVDVGLKLLLGVAVVGILIAFAIHLMLNPSWPIAIVEVFFRLDGRRRVQALLPCCPPESSSLRRAFARSIVLTIW